MALISRVTRLFRADLHAVLDRIEEPEVLLRQAVREMEEDIFASEQRIRLQQHESEQLLSRLRELEQFTSQLDEELDICFDSGKDDLARVLIKRKLEAERRYTIFERKMGNLNDSLSKLQARLEENRLRLVAMQQKADLLGSRPSSPQTEKNRHVDWPVEDITVRDEDVEIAFLREQQKRGRS